MHALPPSPQSSGRAATSQQWCGDSRCTYVCARTHRYTLHRQSSVANSPSPAPVTSCRAGGWGEDEHHDHKASGSCHNRRPTGLAIVSEAGCPRGPPLEPCGPGMWPSPPAASPAGLHCLDVTHEVLGQADAKYLLRQKQVRKRRASGRGRGCEPRLYLEEGYAHQDPGHHNQVVLQPFLKLAHTAFGVDGALLLKLLRRHRARLSLLASAQIP